MDPLLTVKAVQGIFLTLAIMLLGCGHTPSTGTQPSKLVVNGNQTGSPSDYGTFDPSGKYVAISDQDWVDIFESTSGRLYHSFEIPERRSGTAVALWFSNHGTLDVITETAIHTYSLKSAKLVHTKMFPTGDGISGDGPNPVQGNYMLRFDEDSKKIEVWDLRSQTFKSMPKKYLYYGLFSTGKELVAINCKFDGNPAIAYLIKVPSGEVIASTTLDTYGGFENVGCSPDSSFCLIGLTEGHLEKWDFKGRASVLRPSSVDPYNIQISPDARYAIVNVVGPDGRIDVIDCSTGKLISYCIPGPAGWAGTAFGQDGKRMVLGDPAGAAIYRVLDGQKLVVLPNHH